MAVGTTILAPDHNQRTSSARKHSLDLCIRKESNHSFQSMNSSQRTGGSFDRRVLLFQLLLVVLVVISSVTASVLASSSSSSVRQRTSDPIQRGRSLLCLGLFRNCSDNGDDNSDSGNNSTDGSVGGGAGGININTDDFCLGIFRSCDDSNSTQNDENKTDCSEVKGGIFGGRPLFGECGIISDLLFGGSDGEGGILNGTDTDGDGNIDSYEFNFGGNSSDKGPFGLGLLPEGGLLWRIFNKDDNLSFIEAIMNEFEDGTNPFSFGFLEDWSDSAVTSNKTCVNANSAPACFDASGNDGFWVCRTLSDPYTGVPGSKTLCIGEGSFLEKNDVCGCCSAADASSNSTATSPVCPKPCPCTCDLDGTGDGVWILTDLNVLNLENATDLNTKRCVDPRFAVSATESFQRIGCLEKCPTDGGN
jgi:hypothetical protein